MHPSNAFSLHDNSSSSPPPASQQQDSHPSLISPRRRSIRNPVSSVAVTSDITDTSMNVNEVASNGSTTGPGPSNTTGRKSKSTKRRKASTTPTTTSSVDNVQVEVLISPALQSQSQGQNGHAIPISRHKKTQSKSISSRNLAVDITAANTRSNGHGNRNAAGTIKDHVIVDWEIPRKVLHSSIGFLTLSLYLSQSSPTPVIKSLSAALLVVVPCDILRLKWPGPGSKFARLYEKCVGFLMRESEKRKMNGVIWYILGVNFALLVYPLDIAVVAILILSWADTAASTVGRLYGRSTPPLPPQTPILHLPLAPRKSSAGFVAATITGALITTIFYKYIGPLGPHGISWTFEHGVRLAPTTTGVGGFVPAAVRSAMRSWGWEGMNTGGWVGLGVLGVVAGLVAGVAEALDLGSLDDNLTLPIISGGCIWGFFKLLSLFSS